VTLYDSIRLVQASWRRLVIVPALVLAAAGVWLPLAGEYEARALLRSETPAPLLAHLNSRTLAERVGAEPGKLAADTRKGDGHLIDVRARAWTPKRAQHIATEALDFLEALGQRRADRHAREIPRVEAERTALRGRTDLFAYLQTETLTRKLDALWAEVPRGALEVIDFPRVARVLPISAPHIVGLLLLAEVLALLSIFVVAWWRVECAAARDVATRMPLEHLCTKPGAGAGVQYHESEVLAAGHYTIEQRNGIIFARCLDCQEEWAR